MIDVGWLCGVAVRAVYWLVMLACNFLGYSPLWAQNALKKRNMESFRLRTPPHIAVLYTEKLIDKNELMGFLEHCLNAGVRSCSLYDAWGDVHKLASLLVNFCKHYKIGLTVDSKAPFDANNDFSLTVHILSAASGKLTLVDVCKMLCESESEVTADVISEKLASVHNIVDPDLLIQVGGVPSLCGYPPWSLRVTELMHLPRLPASRRAFEMCIETFSRRDIRLGK